MHSSRECFAAMFVISEHVKTRAGRREQYRLAGPGCLEGEPYRCFERLGPDQRHPRRRERRGDLLPVAADDVKLILAKDPELEGERGKALRTLQVEEFGKAGDQWLFSAVSVRHEASRDVDLLQVTHAALQLRLADGFFDPRTLGQPANPPADDQFKPL